MRPVSTWYVSSLLLLKIGHSQVTLNQRKLALYSPNWHQQRIRFVEIQAIGTVLRFEPKEHRLVVIDVYDLSKLSFRFCLELCI